MKPIELRNVRFSYGNDTYVLDGVDLSCEEGTVNTLIGLNGCGKSTLIKVIAGLLKPSEGSVTYGGTELSELSFKERSKRFAYVQQNNVLNNYTVEEYVLFGTANRLDLFAMPGDEEKKIAKEQIGRFGIEKLAKKRLRELSGGERQIVSICSAMSQNTPIMILDEPCSALDILNKDKVLSTLKAISKEDGKTIIMSTHDPNHALYMDSNVFLMKNGKIIDSGAAKDVIIPERLSAIYGEKICYSRDLPYNEVSFGVKG